MKRPAYFAAGSLLVAVGFVGAFLPLLPTTPFLILAAACFARSSPRLEAWLLNHRQFGPALRAWREHGAISIKAKLLACIGMSFGYALFWWAHRPGLLLAAAVAAAMIGAAAYVLSRPSAVESENPAGASRR